MSHLSSSCWMHSLLPLPQAVPGLPSVSRSQSRLLLSLFLSSFLQLPVPHRSTEDPLPRLSILVEILGTKALPGSLDLTSRLFDTLNRVIQNLPATQADVVYISQLLMSAIESTSSKIVVRIKLLPRLVDMLTDPCV